MRQADEVENSLQKSQSLLGKILQEQEQEQEQHSPSGHQNRWNDQGPSQAPNNSNTTISASPCISNQSSVLLGDNFLPRHSDLTIPTSHVSRQSLLQGSLMGGEQSQIHTNGTSPPRRSVFGEHVEQRYAVYNPTNRLASIESSGAGSDTFLDDSFASSETDPMLHIPGAHESNGYKHDSITPPDSPLHSKAELSSASSFHQSQSNSKSKSKSSGRATKKLKAHESLHAQSLLLGFAFMAIWSPLNCMAPNLTEMADFFGFQSEAERDFYLGANIALATGVFSLPLSAGIGILGDMWNRKYLFCSTVILGGLASLATGAAPTYRALFFARLLNGGCMSGSVPVVFSLLGDLFDTSERNTASSGLTAMMGLGILLGQVYAGVYGSTQGWSDAFYMSAVITLISGILVLLLVQEPVRGAKEQVLQDMLKNGTQYERKLTWSGFVHAMHHNKSNSILIWQGFFTSVPWGIIFVFLNDYLSQERGFSVPDATYVVVIFGMGCAAGGVLGGYWGQMLLDRDRSYLPLFMAGTTFIGIFPFVGLLNSHTTNAHGLLAVCYSFMGGFLASLPSVNVRPCLINVNPPETRGAALTAANLIINLARGAGPSCITLMGALFHVNRQFSFNVTLSGFWTLTAIQLVYLSRTLPKDQDAMELELKQYAESAIERAQIKLGDDESIVSIEDRMVSFDVGAARESIEFMGQAFREISDEIRTARSLHFGCVENKSKEEEPEDDAISKAELEQRRQAWIRRQQRQHSERREFESMRNGFPPRDGAFPNETTSLV